MLTKKRLALWFQTSSHHRRSSRNSLVTAFICHLLLLNTKENVTILLAGFFLPPTKIDNVVLSVGRHLRPSARANVVLRKAAR